MLSVALNLKNLSFPPIPETDAFYLTVALISLILPTLLFFCSGRICVRVREAWHIGNVKTTGKARSVKGVDFFEQKEENSSSQHFFRSSPGNFLSLFGGLQSTVRLMASKLSEGGAETKNMSLEEACLFLKKRKIFTGTGIKKAEFLGWLNQIIASGEAEKISSKTLILGVKTIWEMHEECNKWLIKSISQKL